MYTLKKIAEKGKGVEINISLGNSYTVATEDKNPEMVAAAKKERLITDDPIIFGYIVGEDQKVHELSVQQNLYVMTDSGKTFDRLSR